jgi:hypothetical protein
MAKNLTFRKFINGLRIVPTQGTTTTASVEKGSLDVIDTGASGGKLNYHNGTTASPVVTENHTATLTNKTLTSPVLNTSTADTISGIAGNITVTATTTTNLTATANGTVNISSAGSGAVNITSGTGGVTITGGTVGDSVAVKVEDVTFKEYNISHPIVLRVQDTLFYGSGVGGGISSIGGTPIQIQPANNQWLTLTTQGTGQISLGTITAPSAKIQTYNDLIVNKKAVLTGTTNSQTGANVTITTTDSAYIKLTSSVTSISGITNSSNDGQLVLITNSTGSVIIVLNEDSSASAANRIITGTAGNLTLADGGSATFIYNTSTSRWQVVSIVQASAIPTPSITTITTSVTLTNSNDYVLVNGTGITVNLPTTLIPGKTFNIKKIFNDIVPVTIQCSSATIDGLSSVIIVDRYDSLTITTDGSNYFII